MKRIQPFFTSALILGLLFDPIRTAGQSRVDSTFYEQALPAKALLFPQTRGSASFYRLFGLLLLLGSGLWNQNPSRVIHIEPKGWKLIVDVDTRLIPKEHWLKMGFEDDFGRFDSEVLINSEGNQQVMDGDETRVENPFSGFTAPIRKSSFISPSMKPVMFTAILEGPGKERRVLEHFVFHPDHSRWRTIAGLSLYWEEGPCPDLADQMIMEALAVQRLLPAGHAFKGIFLQGPARPSRIGMTFKDGILAGSTDIFLAQDPLFAIASTFHEAVHGYYQSAAMSPSRRKRLANAYRTLMVQAGKQPYPSLQFTGAPEDLENNDQLLVRLFDESTYLDFGPGLPAGSNYGHPYEDDSEFQASGATVLRFFSEKFIQKTLAFQGEKRRQAIARASDIVASFGRDAVKLFPSKVLGLTNHSRRAA